MAVAPRGGLWLSLSLCCLHPFVAVSLCLSSCLCVPLSLRVFVFLSRPRPSPSVSPPVAGSLPPCLSSVCLSVSLWVCPRICPFSKSSAVSVFLRVSLQVCREGPASGMLVIFGGRDSNSRSLCDAWGLRQHRDGRWDWLEAPCRKHTIPEARYQHCQHTQPTTPPITTIQLHIRANRHRGCNTHVTGSRPSKGK